MYFFCGRTSIERNVDTQITFIKRTMHTKYFLDRINRFYMYIFLNMNTTKALFL